jgi:hypothetical protein
MMVNVLGNKVSFNVIIKATTDTFNVKVKTVKATFNAKTKAVLLFGQL